MSTSSVQSAPIEVRESGALLIVGMLLLTAPAAISLHLGHHAVLAASIVVLMIVVTLPFSSLQVLVSEGRLRVKLGGMFTVRNVATADIVSVQRAKVSALAGIGIRWLPNGTLFSVNFGDAVEIALRDGSRFYMGVSAPDGLCTQLTSRIATAS